jgi:hypothetical protein
VGDFGFEFGDPPTQALDFSITHAKFDPFQEPTLHSEVSEVQARVRGGTRASEA